MKLKKIFVTLCALSMVTITYSRRRGFGDVKRITSEKSFEKYARKGLVAVLFYEQGRKPRRRGDATEQERKAWDVLEDKNDDYLAMLKAASDRYLYEEGDLSFAAVDLAREPELRQQADFTVRTTPTVMLFNFGIPIRDSFGNPVQLTGFATQSDLYNFIDSNVGEKLKERKEEKAKIRKRKLEEAKIRSYYAPYFYWGYGYPYYWGWGYPYYGYRWGYWW